MESGRARQDFDNVVPLFYARFLHVYTVIRNKLGTRFTLRIARECREKIEVIFMVYFIIPSWDQSLAFFPPRGSFDV